MPVTRLEESPAFERGGFTFRPLSTPSRGSSELAVWRVAVARGAASEWHSMDREEVFVVDDGQVEVTCGDQLHALGPGDALTVPRGTVLQLRSACDGVAHLIACTSVGMRARLEGSDASFAPPWAE